MKFSLDIFIAYLVEEGKEPSTWRGFTMLLTALGMTINPEVAEHIAAAGIAVTGLIGLFVPDKLKIKDDKND